MVAEAVPEAEGGGEILVPEQATTGSKQSQQCTGPRGKAEEEGHGVKGHAGIAEFEVQMGTRCHAGRSHEADERAGMDDLPGDDETPPQVRIACAPTIAVIDLDGKPVAAVPSDRCDNPLLHRPNG